jgi:transposase-like protein
MKEEMTIDKWLDLLTEDQHSAWLRRCDSVSYAQDEVLRLEAEQRKLTKDLKQAKTKLKRASTLHSKFMDSLRLEIKGDN